MAGNEHYVGTIQKVVKEGRHGPYAVARCEELGSVTFSLKPPVWPENNWPEPGTIVVLGEIIRKRAGWRAQHGRFLRPSDEARSKE